MSGLLTRKGLKRLLGQLDQRGRDEFMDGLLKYASEMTQAQESGDTTAANRSAAALGRYVREWAVCVSLRTDPDWQAQVAETAGVPADPEQPVEAEGLRELLGV